MIRTRPRTLSTISLKRNGVARSAVQLMRPSIIPGSGRSGLHKDQTQFTGIEHHCQSLLPSIAGGVLEAAHHTGALLPQAPSLSS